MKAKVSSKCWARYILGLEIGDYRRSVLIGLHRADRGAERAVRSGYRLVRLQHLPFRGILGYIFYPVA